MVKDKEYVIKAVKDNNVKFIRFWFTDVLGFLKSFAITAPELEDALEDGMGFDGSSIQGFTRIEESDMVAMPDASTFQILPWRPTEENKVARMFCNIQNPDGESFHADPRYVLKNVMQQAADLGYTYYVGPELEYFYFKSETEPKGIDRGGYFDLTPLDLASDLRRDTVLTLEKMGITVEYSHHEVAPSQHEIDLKYADALTMADIVMTYRLVVKEIATLHGLHATFMPKPIMGENGSGMHCHQSLFKGEKNAFFDPNDVSYLSKTAKSYIAGLLKHIKEINLVTNQWVNSYKRLVPGYEAPTYISWAQKNRSALVRVPIYKPGKENATRIELRSPDPAGNPYLVFAVMLAAGLKGIKEGYELTDPVEANIFEMNQEERAEHGIESLPGSLHEAILAAEEGSLLKETLGEELFGFLLNNKRSEWDAYKSQVSPYEIDKYLPIL